MGCLPLRCNSCCLFPRLGVRRGLAQIFISTPFPEEFSQCREIRYILPFKRVPNDSCRLPPSCILCDRNNPSSPDPTLPQPSNKCRPVSLTHLSLGCQDASDLCHGLREPIETRAPSIILVLRVEGQLCTDRDVWVVALGDITEYAGGRIL